MIKSKNNFFKRFIASFLVIVSLMTFANLNGVADFAKEVYAATKSGQIELQGDRREVYGVSWNFIYGTSQIAQYNKTLASGQSTNEYTNMLKKYVVDGGGKNQVNASKSDVPIYRITRTGGYTNPDAGGTIKSLGAVEIDNGKKLIASTNAKLTTEQANMIAKVLYYGLPQFTATSGNNLLKENCYFMATQAIIWEIQEGKRTGWKNDTIGYKSTDNSDYRNASSSYNRSQNMKDAYNSSLSSSYKYYWHDWYYTQYNKYFKDVTGMKDYYNEILNNCAKYGSEITFSTSNKKVSGEAGKFVANSGSAAQYETNWNNTDKSFDFVFTLNGNCSIGNGIGQYNISNLKVQYNNNGSWANLGTNDYKVSVSGNKVTLKINKNTSNSFKNNQNSNKQYRLVWKPNTYDTNIYNKANVLRTDGANDNASRGYVNCGGVVTVPYMYLKLQTYVCKITYKCNVCGQTIGSETVPKGSYPTSIPSHTEDGMKYNGWITPKNKTITQTELKKYIVNNDTTFTVSFEKLYNLNVYCAYCGELISSKSGTKGTKVNLPSNEDISAHFESHTTPEDYSSIISDGKYYTSQDQTQQVEGLENNSIVTINENKVYYAGYKCNATVQFVCDANEYISNYNKENDTNEDLCDTETLISSAEVPVGTNYNIPDSHNHNDCLGPDKTVYFVGWAEKIIDSVTYEYDEDGNICYDENGNPVIEDVVWHYSDFIPADQKEVTVNKNTTYYAVYTETKNVDITIELINISDFTSNGYSVEGLNPISKTTNSYPIAVINNDTHSLESNYVNLQTEYKLANPFSFEEDVLVDNEKTVYTWTGQYLTSNGENNIASLDDLKKSTTIDENNNFTFEDVFFSNHLVSNDETIYLFYNDNSNIANINVIVVSPEEKYLNAYSTDGNESNLTGSLYYTNTDGEFAYEWKQGISTNSIELSKSNKQITPSQAEKYLPSEYNDCKYYSYYTISFDKNEENIDLLNELLNIGATINDQNGYCDYRFLAEASDTYITYGKTANLIFVAEKAQKVKYQFVDEGGSALADSVISTVINPNVIADMAKAANEHNRDISEITGSITGMNTELYGEIISALRNIDTTDEVDSENYYKTVISDKNGFTEYTNITDCYAKTSHYGNYWIVNFIEQILNEENNDNTYFDIDFYNSGNCEDDNWKKITPVYKNDRNINLNDFCGKDQFPNNTLINTFDTLDGNVLVKITVKNSYPPLTVNVHFPKSYNFQYAENVSSLDINIETEDGNVMDCSKNFKNLEVTHNDKGSSNGYNNSDYPYMVSTTLEVPPSEDVLKVYADKIDSQKYNADGNPNGNVLEKSTYVMYKTDINNRVIDLYVVNAEEQGVEELKIDIVNNSSYSSGYLGISRNSKPYFKDYTASSTKKVFGQGYTTIYNYYDVTLNGNVSINEDDKTTSFAYKGYFDENNNCTNSERYLKSNLKTIISNTDSNETKTSFNANPLGLHSTYYRSISHTEYGEPKFNDLKLNTECNPEEVVVKTKYYSPYMLYSYINGKSIDCSGNTSDTIDNFYTAFNVKEEDKSYFREHINDLIFFANYGDYLKNVKLTEKTLSSAYINYYEGYEFETIVDMYNNDNPDLKVNKNTVYSVIDELAKRGYEFGQTAQPLYDENGYYYLNLSEGFRNTTPNSKFDKYAIYDSYYYALVEISNAPNKITFDFNLPDNVDKTSLELTDIVTYQGQNINYSYKNGDKTKITISTDEFFNSTINENSSTKVFSPLLLADAFKIRFEFNETDPKKLKDLKDDWLNSTWQEKQDRLYELNEQGLLCETQNDGTTTDSYNYKAVAWGSSRDTNLYNRALMIDSNSAEDLNTENHSYLVGKIEYKTKGDGNDKGNYYYAVKELLDDVAENNGNGNYTLYLNWIGLPTVETYSTVYSLDQIQNVEFSDTLAEEEGRTKSGILDLTTKFHASEKRNGEEYVELSPMRMYSNQEMFDKWLKKNANGIDTAAGCEFESGAIQRKENEPAQFKNVEEFMTALHALDEDYLKTYGYKEIVTDENGDTVHNEDGSIKYKYKICCTYNLYYWDENLADSFVWTDGDMTYNVPLNSPKQYVESITFWVESIKDAKFGKEIRYISLKYFEDENQNLVPYEEGGLKYDSKWRKDDLRLILRKILTNTKDENGVWAIPPQYDFTVSVQEVKEAKEYMDSYTNENGVGSYCDETMLNHIYQKYIEKQE